MPSIIFRAQGFDTGREWDYIFAALHSSSYIRMSRLMCWFTGNIGYHHVHHLNSKIPFYRLPEAMAAIKELQAPVTTSLRPRDIFACLRLKLWDPVTEQHVPWKQAPHPPRETSRERRLDLGSTHDASLQINGSRSLDLTSRLRPPARECSQGRRATTGSRGVYKRRLLAGCRCEGGNLPFPLCHQTLLLSVVQATMSSVGALFVSVPQTHG